MTFKKPLCLATRQPVNYWILLTEFRSQHIKLKLNWVPSTHFVILGRYSVFLEYQSTDLALKNVLSKISLLITKSLIKYIENGSDSDIVL